MANYKYNTVSVLNSTGDGTFGTQKIVAVGKGPDDVNFADFNGDGIEDLVRLNYTDDSVDLLLGRASGNYALVGPFAVGDSPYSAAVGSLNVDGTPDIVVSNCFSNNTGVLLDGTLLSPCLTADSLRTPVIRSAPLIPRTAPASTDQAPLPTPSLHQRLVVLSILRAEFDDAKNRSLP